ncbi:S-layer homology domain-containing protein [Brevibacillus sp. NPDC058079]|uniref:S-layer homology domain-containing protein n=1 Tax=Brevibacillus sp. NPDC058079 TaxID=3346330 RepID=UPI0036E19A8C
MKIIKRIRGVALSIAFAVTVLCGGGLPQSVAKAETSNSFTDVQTHWVKETVDWALEKNMVNGYPDGTFRPEKKVTEAEFLTMLLRLYEPNLQGETASHWADRYYAYGAGYNYILPGNSQRELRNKVMNRYQVAELIASTEGVNLKGNDAVKYLLVFHLATGKGNQKSIAAYKGNDSLTRAEALQFVRNVSTYGLGALVVKPKRPTDPNLIPNLVQ